jgi:hypothetical protein
VSCEEERRYVIVCRVLTTTVDHKGVVFRPKRPDIHEEGSSSGCLSFYCKGDHHYGKDPNVIGCNAKEPSTIKLRFTVHFSEGDPIDLVSDTFRVQGTC